MDLDPGEIYFIREQLDGGYSEYTKIGLVREKPGRSSLDRAKEHQTGNPRPLVPIGVVTTVFVSETENALHREFASRRILPGEWFRLDDSQLQQAIARCTELAATNLSYVPMFEQAEELEQEPSTSELLPASADASHWGEELRCAAFGLKLISTALDSYKTFLVEARTRGVLVEDYIDVAETAGRQTLDRALFKDAHPGIVAAFTVTATEVIPKFSITSMKGEDFASDARLASVVASTGSLEAAIQRAEVTNGALDSMHQLFLTLIGLEPALKKSRAIAEANLKVLCGINAGIDGICTWSRTEKETMETDWKAIKDAHPAEHAACMRMGTPSQRVNFKRGAGAESSEG
jgi:hypothetical protein